MNLKELDDFRLDDAVKFRDRLNPALFVDEKLKSEIREQLLLIAEDFIDHLGLDDLKVKDITLSGSNAAYTYTNHSDVDIHLLVDYSKLDPDDIYRELLNSKKVIYNDSHDIKVRGYDVELYVQDVAEPVKSLGEYSIQRDKWIKFPSRQRSNFDELSTKNKFEKLAIRIQTALRSGSLDDVELLLDKIKKYRQTGLEKHGEFGPENLAFKALRSRGLITKLYDYRDKLHSEQLSISEVELEEEYSEFMMNDNLTRVGESASGYIPSTKEKNDSRFKTALTVDIKPDSIQKNADKLKLGKIHRSGVPPTARYNGKIK